MKRLALLALLAACDGQPATEPERLRATVTRPPDDTITFTAPAVARRCTGSRGEILLEAASGHGGGVLVLLRGLDSTQETTYPLIPLGDSLTARGAQVSARFVFNGAAHGFTMDSGVVEVSASPRRGLEARIRGAGYEGSLRNGLTAELRDVPPPPAGDTANCAFQ